MMRRTKYKLLSGLLAASLVVPYPVGAAALEQDPQTVQEVSEETPLEELPSEEEESEDVTETEPGEIPDGQEEELPAETPEEEPTEIPEEPSEEVPGNEGETLEDNQEDSEQAQVLTDDLEASDAVDENSTAKTVDGQWQETEAGVQFQNADGSFVKSDFQKIGDYWFYFDDSGYLATGWQTISGKRYYFQRSGELGTLGKMWTGWLKNGGEMLLSETKRGKRCHRSDVYRSSDNQRA